ncbi:MAG: rubrerythrin family protein [Candidatus Krumholzibacteria bacterium]|nr:rubrerythrin family protein [Candidatus Krumholzibacteria bacterium]
MSSKENLETAFAGESQANRKYLAFAKKADADGYPQVAKLFRAAAEAETIHAHAHFKALGGVGDTADNLVDAVAGEGYEFKEMYPPFLSEAEAEGNDAAARSFRFALAVEEVHHGLYGKALEAVKGGGDLPGTPIHVCPVCGNTFEGETPDKCPVCNVPKEKFFEVM